ncbi:MAG: lytic transglycosylase domain-containing protein [Actinomycetota bacterium]|nr:lytic transglycosylase domain-containing protein [Actinomycetota bacterium]
MFEGLNSVICRIETIEARFSAPSAQSPKFAAALGSAKGTLEAGVASGGKLSASVPFQQEILAASKKHGLDPALIAAVISAESGFRADAKSTAGALGLMQLMPKTAAGLGVTDPLNPAQNIDGGSRYLKIQLTRFGDLELALAAYNAGPKNVDKYNGVPPFAETERFIERVLAKKREFSGGGSGLG